MRSILGLGLILLLAGCGATAGKGGGDPLAGTAWTLDDLAGKGLPAGASVTARFHEGRIGGTAGCNQYFASYEVRGDSVRVGPAGTTKMMCPEPQMTVESAFLAFLGGVKTYKLADGRLQLQADGDRVLDFAAAPFEAAGE